MPVQKTESRFPPGLSATDFGEAVVASGQAGVSIISFFSTPVVNEEQTYCVFVTDAPTAGRVQSYEWRFTLGSASPVVQTTSIGIKTFTPATAGSLEVQVRLLDSSSAVVATVALTRTVSDPNPELERLIDQTGTHIPVAAHPVVSREVINNIRPYVDALVQPSADEVLNRLILCIIYGTMLQLNTANRLQRISDAAAALNNNRHADFGNTSHEGIGICNIRPYALSLFYARANGDPFVSFRTIAERGRPRTTAITQLLADFNTQLSEDDKIDLFNLLRFPKSSATVCKLMLEKLRDRYFAGMSFSEIFNDANKIKRLLSQFEKGPAPATPAITATTFSTQVFNLMQQLLWQIASTGYTPITGAGSVLGTYRIGEPEDFMLPPTVYVVQGSPTDTAIQSVVDYHQTYGVQVERFVSIEDLITKLSADNFTMERMRFVAHAHPTNLGVAFFTNTVHFSIKEFFAGFAISDAEGIKSIIGVGFDRTRYHYAGSYLGRILTALREPARSAVLLPFGLETTGSPTGDLLEFFDTCKDRNFLNLGGLTKNGAPFSVGERNDWHTAFTIISDSMIPTLTTGAVQANHLQALRTAIEGLTLSDLNMTNIGFRDFVIDAANPDIINPFPVLHEALRAISQNFRTKLNAARQRFNNNCFIDLRGCRFGQVPDNLVAMQAFFGNTGQLPHVSAPEWYQSFPGMGYQTFITDTHLNDLFNNGITVSSRVFDAADIIQAFNTAKAQMEMPAQLNYLITKFDTTQTSAIDFLSFRWAAAIPNLKVIAPRIEEFPSLSFTNKLDRLKSLFNISALQLTPPVNAARLELVFNNLITLLDIEARVVATTPATEFPNLRTQLGTVATNLGQSALVPNPPPPTIQLSDLQGYVAALRTYITTQAAALDPFRAALSASATATNTGEFKYFFRIGLPLIVPVMNLLSPIAYFIFCFDATSDLSIRSFMRAQWEGALPSANRIATLHIADVAALQVSMLSMHQDPEDSHTPITECYISPMTEYDQHIIHL